MNRTPRKPLTTSTTGSAPASKPSHMRWVLTAMAAAALLTACGGGESISEPEVVISEVTPTYHLANVLPPDPSDIDADGNGASALSAPLRLALRDDLSNADTAGTTGEEVRRRVLSAPREGAASPAAAAAAVTAYTPAQIRAAYGLSNLPVSSVANKGAYQGSGQTIAIIGAYHNPGIANDLATFNQKFGLPTCAIQSVAINAAMPLAKPVAGSSCSFALIYTTAAGAMTTKAPAVNAGWATETSLDVEWAHAMAPQARILLIEAPSASGADLLNAVALAGKLGANVVSMSWGGSEYNGQTTTDKYFQTAGISYLAASGDSGRGVSWPAVSPNVLAVGGTKLSASGNARTEVAWTGSGGGLSRYTPTPTWQAAIKVTNTTGVRSAPSGRAVPDIALNADPNSGQLIYSAAGGGWLVAGGTSISAPQWAGLVAIENAVRATSNRPALGGLAPLLYKNLAANAALYGSNLLDVSAGANGACLGCNAMVGYDLVTGLGTPNSVALVNTMSTW